MVGAPLGELVRHDRFFQLGLTLDQAPRLPTWLSEARSWHLPRGTRVLAVQFVAPIVRLLGAAPGNFGRGIDALLLRLADIILAVATHLLMGPSASSRDGVISDGHDLLSGR
jgi:hypothetical protein